MQYSSNLITRLIEFINEDDSLSALGIAIRAYDTRGLPVPINETYFSFSCQENSASYSRNEENVITPESKVTVKMNCFSPLKKSAYSAHNLAEKIIGAICNKFADDISGFTISETHYDDDVKSYKITGLIYFNFIS